MKATYQMKRKQEILFFFDVLSPWDENAYACQEKEEVMLVFQYTFIDIMSPRISIIVIMS